MKLETKKSLASRALNMSKGRIVFNSARLSEIKEAITKQDIKDLTSSGAISIKDPKGRKKTKKRKTRRRAGSIKKKVNTRKQDYVKLTRKLRTFLRNVKTRMKLSNDDCKELRKIIRASEFRSLAHMKEKIKQMKEED